MNLRIARPDNRRNLRFELLETRSLLSVDSVPFEVESEHLDWESLPPRSRYSLAPSHALVFRPELDSDVHHSLNKRHADRDADIHRQHRQHPAYHDRADSERRHPKPQKRDRLAPQASPKSVTAISLTYIPAVDLNSSATRSAPTSAYEAPHINPLVVTSTPNTLVPLVAEPLVIIAVLPTPTSQDTRETVTNSRAQSPPSETQVASVNAGPASEDVEAPPVNSQSPPLARTAPDDSLLHDIALTEFDARESHVPRTHQPPRSLEVTVESIGLNPNNSPAGIVGIEHSLSGLSATADLSERWEDLGRLLQLLAGEQADVVDLDTRSTAPNDASDPLWNQQYWDPGEMIAMQLPLNLLIDRLRRARQNRCAVRRLERRHRILPTTQPANCGCRPAG